MKLTADKPLGKTGLHIPPIIYGTSYLGNLYKALSYKDKLELMKTWFKCTEKPVVIDTAGKYGAGLALEVIGKGLSELGMEKDAVIISNKLGWYRVALETEEPTFEPGVWEDLKYDARTSFGYNEIIECYEQGNELLRDYSAKIVSVHDPDEYLAGATSTSERKKRKERVLNSYKALFDLKEKGKVIAVGIGSKDWKVIRELYDEVKFDWVMFANSFTIYRHPDELLSFMDLLYKNGSGIVNSALFHGGFLTGSDKFDYRDVNSHSESGKKLYQWRELFYTICNKFNVDPADACIHFGISHPAIASIALNTSKPEKMSHNAQILNKKIPEDFWAEMKKAKLIHDNYKYL